MIANSAETAQLRVNAMWKVSLAVVASSLLTAFVNESPFAYMALLWTMVPWFSGLADLARAKGRNSWLALLGVLHVVGLILLIVMPSRPSQPAA